MKQRLTLSKSKYELKQNGYLIDGSSLKIKAIDEISPKIAKQVNTLILANNMITKIENIRQFIILVELDISYNHITNCNELLKLLQLQKLAKLKINGNPFLLEPLNEQVLEFLLQKQTDMEVFNGEILNKMKDLQEGEFQLAFLENYLKKKNCHQQIFTRKLSEESLPNREMIPECNTNKHIINKIMPQYCKTIEDEKLKKKIKKETINLKKSQKVSFQQAMKKQKEKQQKQVDHLLKDILDLVQQQQSQKYQTFKQSPSKKWTAEASKKKLQYQSIKKQGKDNLYDSVPISNSLRKKFQRFHNHIKNEELEKSKTSSKYGGSPDRENPYQRIINSSEKGDFKVEAFSPKNARNMTTKHQSGEIQTSNFYSFNRTMPMPFNKMFAEIPKQTSRHQKSNINEQSAQKSGSEEESRDKVEHQNKQQQRCRQKAQKDQQWQFTQLGNEIPPQNFYDQYYNHLTKYNPTFNLLYSDIASLSSEQKQILIEALSKDHKEKTVQLYHQQLKIKKLKQLIISNTQNYEKQIQHLVTQVSDQGQVENLRKNYITQMQRQNLRLNELIKGLSEEVTKFKEDNWDYKQDNLNKEQQIKALQSNSQTQKQLIAYLQKCQDIADIIKQKWQQRLKRRYMEKLKQRLHQLGNILQLRQKRQKKQKNRLIKLSWSHMKKFLLMYVLTKIKNQQKNNQLLKVYFNIWKSQKQKEIINKQNIKKIIFNKMCQSFKFFKFVTTKKIKYRKQHKLHVFWSNRQFLKAYFAKLQKRVKQAQIKCKQNMEVATIHHIKYVQRVIFNKIKICVKDTKQSVINSYAKIDKNRKQYLYYLLRKEHFIKAVKTQTKNKINSVSKLIRIQLQHRKKKTAIKAILKENKLIRYRTRKLLKNRRLCEFTKFKNITMKILQQKQINAKGKKYINMIFCRRFLSKLSRSLKIFYMLKKILQKYKTHNTITELNIERKSYFLEQQLNIKRQRQVYYKLLRNFYNQKVVNYEINQRIQLEETKKFIEKMKNIDQMEIQAIKSQQTKQLQLLQQEEFKKQIQYRKSLMVIENSNKQLQGLIKLLKSQLQGLKQRQLVFYKEKQLMNEQLQLQQNEKNEMKLANQNLKSDIANVTHKYNRMLEMYREVLLEIEKKQKIAMSSLSVEKLNKYEKSQKTRFDKTVEKQKRNQKRPTGVVRNGEFVSLRNRT